MKKIIKSLLIIILITTIITLSSLITIRLINSKKYLNYNLNKIDYVKNITNLELKQCQKYTSLFKLTNICNDIVTKNNVLIDLENAKTSSIYLNVYKRNLEIVNNKLLQEDDEAKAILTNKLTKIYVDNLFPTSEYNKLRININYLDEFIIFNLILLIGLIVILIIAKYYSVISISLYTVFILISTLKYILWKSKIIANIFYQNEYISSLFISLFNNIINYYFIFAIIFLIIALIIDVLTKHKNS